MALQIWTMNSDGSNKKQIQITMRQILDLIFSDGNYIIFSSNLLMKKEEILIYTQSK